MSLLRPAASLLLVAAFALAGGPDARATSPVDAVVAAHPAAPDATLLPQKALREDLDALYSGLQAAHYDLYVRRDREAYDRRHRELRAQLDRPLSPLQAQIVFQRFVAYGNVAHARIDPPMEAWEQYRAAGGKAFPLHLRVQRGAVHVIAGGAGIDALVPGARVSHVDGVDALAWLGRLRAHVSADTDYLAHAQMEGLLPILAWLEFGPRESFRIRFEGRDGRAVERTVPARSRAEAQAAAAKEPESFALDANAREARMLDGRVAYLKPGPFYDNRPEAAHPWDATAFHTFIDEAFAKFSEARATTLLVDLRDNPGGDNSFSDRMIAWFADRPFRFTEAFEIRVSAATTASNRRRLEAQGGGEDSVSARLDAAYAGKPEGSIVRFPVAEVPPRAAPRFEGEVFLLVNRHSYSNTVLVAAIVQDERFGTVLGEETADLASTYGAMEQFTLPRSGFVVGYPKARILRPNGDPAPRGVVPDVAIDSPLAAQRDVVLEKALRIIRRGAMRTD